MSSEARALPRHRFLVLDAMRGVAALAVMLFHSSGLLHFNLLPHGYLAVDFFFLLSGFVISFSYQERLDAGWSTLRFLTVRLIRLYPLYFAALVLGLIAAVVSRWHSGRFISGGLGIDFVMGLLLLPQIGRDVAAFPLNLPTWSLWGEIVANVIHAVFFRRLSTLVLSAATALMGVVLAAATLQHGGMDFGFAGRGVFFLLPRVLTSYMLGMLAVRYWRGQKRPLHWGVLAPFGLLVAMLGARFAPGHTAVFDLLAVLVFFPLTLMLGAAADVVNHFRVPFELAGQASYALYLIHIPLLTLYQAAWPATGSAGVTLHRAACTALFVVLVIVLSLAGERLYDIPVRSWLRRRFGS